MVAAEVAYVNVSATEWRSCSVFVDGKQIAEMADQEKITLELVPGYHSVFVKVKSQFFCSYQSEILVIDFKVGETVFLQSGHLFHRGKNRKYAMALVAFWLLSLAGNLVSRCPPDSFLRPLLYDGMLFGVFGFMFGGLAYIAYLFMPGNGCYLKRV